MVEDGREPPFDAQEVAQGKPELGSEYLATVADNRVRQNVMSNYNIENDFYQYGCSYCHLHRLVVYYFR